MEAFYTPCAICGTVEKLDSLILAPVPDALVMLHRKCMGGLPLIALKWNVNYSTNTSVDPHTTLADYLQDYPEHLSDFDS